MLFRLEGVPVVMNMPSLGVKELTSWQELESIRPDWERILQENRDLSIFCTPEWLGAWWKAYGKGKQLKVLTFLNQRGELLGLALLYAQEPNSDATARFTKLLLVGDGTHDSDNLDLIFQTEYVHACSNALLSWLDGHRDWDVCQLNTLNEESRAVTELQTALKRWKWPTLQSVRPRSAIRLPGSWEEYKIQLSKKYARGLERTSRDVSSRYATRAYRCATKEEVAQGLETLFNLHQKRWQSKSQPGAFAADARREFYKELSLNLMRRGWLELWMLRLNENAVAVHFSFRYGNTVYHLQEGVDPDYLEQRVGVVLRIHVLQQLIKEGVSQYDFLGGTDTHKKLWRAELGIYKDIWFARRISRGAIYLAVTRAAISTKKWFNTKLSNLGLYVPRYVGRAVRLALKKSSQNS